MVNNSSQIIEYKNDIWHMEIEIQNQTHKCGEVNGLPTFDYYISTNNTEINKQ
jgi:hypothetical protein